MSVALVELAGHRPEPISPSESNLRPDFTFYQHSGGTLDESHYSVASHILETIEEGTCNLERNMPGESSARSIATKAEVELTNTQARLFGILRMTIEIIENPIGRTINKGMPTLYSDAPLLAEVVLMTGNEVAYHKIHRKFPPQHHVIDRIR